MNAKQLLLVLAVAAALFAVIARADDSAASDLDMDSPLPISVDYDQGVSGAMLAFWCVFWVAIYIVIVVAAYIIVTVWGDP